MNISINHNAPVIARAEITIEAPIEIVWHVLTTINSWPEWQKAITAAQLNGDLKEGVGFDWKSGGLRLQIGMNKSLEELKVTSEASIGQAKTN